MPKHCPDCRQGFPDFVDFCVADGSRLVPGLQEDGENGGERELEDTEELGAVSLDDSTTCIPGRARIYPKVRGTTQPYVLEFFGDVVVGRFDPDVGAVDVDLGDMPGAEYVSPKHAFLSFEGGEWTIEDLGSENGVFINRGPRITERTTISNGDELALGNALFVFEADVPEKDED